ncbi:MAG: hypothetical protein Q8O19_02265 [Rectinemataceae bacterium]|nr:hypothetical protein [Rectinemataceae bacterium]
MISRWHSINGIKFMKDMLYNGFKEGDEKVTLTVERRHDAVSRMWLILGWTGADGSRQEVAASTFDLVFRRAVELEQQIEAKCREEPK